jgi:hypothetical protein
MTKQKQEYSRAYYIVRLLILALCPAFAVWFVIFKLPLWNLLLYFFGGFAYLIVIFAWLVGIGFMNIIFNLSGFKN